MKRQIFNTIKTINSIGMDLIIIRHFSSGAAYFLAKNTNSSVINAGDGSHAHPTQALSDLLTIYELENNFEDLEIFIALRIASLESSVSHKYPSQ